MVQQHQQHNSNGNKRTHDQLESDSPTHSSKNAGHGAVKISRKIRACKECQGRKIRCDIQAGEASCSRCRRLGLECVVNKSLQTLLEEENEWKVSVENQLSDMRHALTEVLRVVKIPELADFETNGHGPLSATSSSSHAARHRITSSLGPELRADLQSHISPQADKKSPNTGTGAGLPGMAMTRENSQEPQIQEGEGVVDAPMASLFEVTKLRNLRSNLDGRHADVSPLKSDFISQGRVSVKEAEELFQVFKNSLNHYLWGGIALVHDDLTSVRNSSSQLMAAILAVTALHIPDAEPIFDKCYDEFLNLVSASMFDRYHSLDDVRGLCIGAFWLSDVSWKLSGHAVRIGTELNLHQSFSRAMRGSTADVERARLWYLLYVCDHHFSIAYGRPPVTHENEAIACHESFLQLPGIAQADYRLQSQVGVFLILSRIFHTFGTDSARILTEADLASVEKYNYELDSWKTHWEPRLAPSEYIASYPARGVGLHNHFAKVQLNALVLRGIRSSAENMTPKRRHFAELAVSSAIKTLEDILTIPDISRSVVGVPLYLTTLISFCTIFLLKVQMTWKNLHLAVDATQVTSLLERIVDILEGAKTSARHLAPHIAVGLRKILSKFKTNAPRSSLNNQQPRSTGGLSDMNADAGAMLNQGMMGAGDMSWVQYPSPMGGDGMYGDMMGFYGLEEQYFPLGIFDALPAQVPH